MQVNIDGVERTLPDFIIVGAAKSATTSLFFYLKQAKGVFFPAIKEPWYFCYRNEFPKLGDAVHPDGVDAKGVHVFTDSEYFALFESALDDVIVGEASTAYLHLAEKTISNIKLLYGERARSVKIIMVLRNPIERAWSHYMMHVRDGMAESNFLTAIEERVVKKRIDAGWTIAYDYVGQSMYSEKVARFKDEFDDVKVILFEEMESEPQLVVEGVFQFLGIENRGQDVDVKTKYNVSGTPDGVFARWVADFLYKPNGLKTAFKFLVPHPLRVAIKASMSGRLLKRSSVPPEVYSVLKNRFYSDIQQLETIVGKDLSAWK